MAYTITKDGSIVYHGKTLSICGKKHGTLCPALVGLDSTKYGRWSWVGRISGNLRGSTERSRVVSSYSESYKIRRWTCSGCLFLQRLSRGYQTIYPVKFSLNATLSSLDYQYLLWIMRHKGINFQQIIAPKSTNKL